MRISFSFFFVFARNTREMGKDRDQEGNVGVFKIQSEFAGSRCVRWHGVVRFHGFFELAAGFFHGHGNVDRSFLTFSRASNDRFLFLPATPRGLALFRIIIPALLDKIFMPPFHLENLFYTLAFLQRLASYAPLRLTPEFYGT